MNEEVKRYSIISKELTCSFEKAFKYIVVPKNLEKWTIALKKADDSSSMLDTPDGPIKIGLKTVSNNSGVIDWHMTMPDDSKMIAHSRLLPLPNGNTLYIFSFFVNHIPADQVKEVIEAQTKVVETELNNLEEILRS